jgi:L-amino acid N-acyltransferase YncA
MPHKILVRTATTADIPAITAIYRHHVLHGLATFEIEPPDENEMTRRFAAIAELGLPYLAAEIMGNVAGYAYAGVYRPRPAYRFTVENSIYVAASHTGQGAGSALMPALIEGCAAAGRRQIIAVIGDSENLGSIRLHEKFGFARVGLLPAVGYKFGRWVDSILMQRDLGEARVVARNER